MKGKAKNCGMLPPAAMDKRNSKTRTGPTGMPAAKNAGMNLNGKPVPTKAPKKK